MCSAIDVIGIVLLTLFNMSALMILCHSTVEDSLKCVIYKYLITLPMLHYMACNGQHCAFMEKPLICDDCVCGLKPSALLKSLLLTCAAAEKGLSSLWVAVYQGLHKVMMCKFKK